MVKYKRISIITMLVFIFSIIPSRFVQAMENINIISNTIITKEDATEWAYKRGASEIFVALADLYWNDYKNHGQVNPAIAYVQGALETNFGHFGGVLNESYKNPCGMKNSSGGGDFDANAHYKFSTWKEGVDAQLDHLALYAGAKGYPKNNKNTTDPRHFGRVYGVASNVLDLSSKWASNENYGKDVVRLYSELEQFSRTRKKPKMNLELPKQNLKVDKNTLKVAGWALHGAEIKEVKIYINNEFLGEAKLGIARLDVNRAFPNYPNGDKSGFSEEFNISHIASGEKIVKVEALAKDGSKITRISKIVLEKKPAKMNLELPKQNEVVEGNTLKIGGWALHGSGIREVKLYVDNEFIGNLNVGLKRADVNRVFPNYDNGENSGFSGEFNLNNIALGEKVIKTIAIGNDGTEIVRACKVNIKKKQPKMNLERTNISNENNETYLNVAGWALNGSGVEEIKVYVDNNFIGNAPLGLHRPDVNRAFKNYPNGEHSGFNEKFNMKFIAPGEKEVKVQVIGNDGTSISRISKITLKKKPSKLNLEEPTNDLTLKGRELKIAGWALNDSGIKEVKIYLDDTYVGNADLGIHRADVNRVFKNYTNGEHSGFTAKFDIRKFAPGYHNIKAVAIGNDNTFREMSKSIKFNHKKLIVIDPGHNTNPSLLIDTGSSFSHNEVLYKEAKLNMELAVKLKDALSNLGYEVILTQNPLERTYDKTVIDSLGRRVNLANNLKADLFISVHHNEFTSIMAYGVETWYSNFREVPCNSNAIEDSEKLATALVNTLSQSGDFYNRGAKKGRFFVTRNTEMPSVLIEAGFLSNPKDAKKAADENHQLKVAKSLANTVDKYFESIIYSN